MSPPRVAFFGSPEFAIPTLRALIASPFRPVVVVTQPDRPAGRGRSLRPPPAKELATGAGIPLLQPARLRDASATAALASYEPELQVIAAYGQILRPEVLALPAWGTFNVHASLLPRWRGAAPIAAAIRAGDRETGITIMLAEQGEDTGEILAARPEPIDDSDDAGALSERLADLGAALLLETIPRWLDGEIIAHSQDERLATRARRITKVDGAIDWTRPAVEIWRQVRAFTPWPGATTSLRGTPLHVRRASPASAARDSEDVPGTILAVDDAIAVQTGGGVLHIERVQLAGKRAMSAREFARGRRELLGVRLGAPAAEPAGD